MRECNYCFQEKQVTEFYPSDRYKCIDCNKKLHRRYYERTYKARRDKYRAVQYKNSYGLTIAEYDELLVRQDGKCAICKLPPDKKRLCIDHDHKTGKVRGLLCDRCNLLLGRVYDDCSILSSAIEYLNQTK